MTDSSTPPQTSPLQELIAKHALSPAQRAERVQAAQLLRVASWPNPRSEQRAARTRISSGYALNYWIDLVASTVPDDGSYRTLVRIFSTRVERLRAEGLIPQVPPPPLPVPPDAL